MLALSRNAKTGLILATIALAWFLAGFTGWLRIANTAHAAGLVLGMLWGRVAAYQAMRKPE